MSGWYKTCTSSPRVSYRSRHAGEGLNTIQLHGERDSDIMCMFDMYQAVNNEVSEFDG